MTDARLQELYRRLNATRDDVTADDVSDALGRHGYPDVEGTALDRIATSTAHADILRTVMALAPDAEAFARDAAQLRAPSRPQSRPLARRFVALAAGIAALGMVVVMQRAADAPTLPEGVQEANQVILSASFESSGTFESTPAEQMQVDDAGAIFGGDFDS
jgi:hypothetical protein